MYVGRWPRHTTPHTRIRRLIQLRTRRPVLLNIASLDQISYLPASGALANPPLRGVYGIDLLAATPTSMKGIEALWESRSLAEWQEIGDEFDVADVLVWNSYRLQLPLIETDHEFSLYRIPARIRHGTEDPQLAALRRPSILFEPPIWYSGVQASVPEYHE